MDLSDQLGPEEGTLWIHDVDGGETLAFTDDGIEALRQIINDQRNHIACTSDEIRAARCSPDAYRVAGFFAFQVKYAGRLGQ